MSELTPDTTSPRDPDALEAPAPLVPAEPLTKDESKLALGIVAGFLVLALVIGIYGASRIGSGTDLEIGAPPKPATRTTTVAPSSGEPSASASPGATGAPEPLAILKVEAYDPDVNRRLRVKPGLTGLWQVSGRSDLSWEDTVRLDLYYVDNWSMFVDIQILLRTAKAVFGGSGAY